MLVKTSEAQVSDSEKIQLRIFLDYWAIDLETGAHLLRSRGRARSGNHPRWFLIVPQDGKLTDSRSTWARKVFRAPDLDEAIAIAQPAIPKLVAKLTADRPAPAGDSQESK